MYTHIVHIERPNISGYDARVGNGPRFRINGSMTGPQVTDTGIGGCTRGEEYQWETWYCADEASARSCAEMLAAQRPGKQVYIAKVVAVASASNPRVSVANVTEQGVVPA